MIDHENHEDQRSKILDNGALQHESHAESMASEKQ